MHGPGSRNKLTPSHARRLYPGDGLFDRLGRAVCEAGCLPRKELHEAWEMAARVRARFRGGRVVDLCAGFGLLAQVLVLTDDTLACALAVDVRLPANHARVHAAVVAAFPALAGDRVRFVQAPLAQVALCADDLVVSSHACGALTDDVLARAAAAGARFAVLPCCHATRFRDDLRAMDDPAAAIDEDRAAAQRARGYHVWIEAISAAVTPKNRLLLGAPRPQPPA